MKKISVLMILLFLLLPLPALEPFFSMGPNVLVNTGDQQKSAPSPVIMFSLGGGFKFSFYKNFAVEPGISFFTNYYSWEEDDNYAYPIEYENRTALVFSMLTEIPIVYSWNIGKHRIYCGPGIAFLARVGVTALGADSGTSGSAESDVQAINKWLWSNGRFLYPEICAGWSYKANDKTAGGLYISYLLPVGSLSTGHELDASIIKIEARIYF